jgi:uncharacterized membrane protein
MDKDIEKIVQSGADQLTKLKCIVEKTMEDERLITDNLLNPPKDILTRGQKISDKVARFGGSWSFIISFFIILIAWITYNSLVPKNEEFDKYPFILMNLILSCIAALQAPVIMMSQNRQEEKDRLRGENDYLINLKAELEIRGLQQKMDLLLEEQIQILFDTQAKQLEILKSLEEKVEKLQK